MKEQKLYVCEFCGTQYIEKQSALNCEKNHHTPTDMRQPQYHAAKYPQDGYPDRIEIVFDDGKVFGISGNLPTKRRFQRDFYTVMCNFVRSR